MNKEKSTTENIKSKGDYQKTLFYKIMIFLGFEYKPNDAEINYVYDELTH